MNLADYLVAAQDRILSEAIAYARTLPALKNCTEQQLRNHLPKVLNEIATDLRTPQTSEQSIAKSHGLAPVSTYATAAGTHGLQRARGGLTIEELVAEYRALRSSVLRLWGQNTALDEGALEDIGRFNEAIDQAVAESVRTYAAETHKWQQLFLGIVGHDLRTPLNAVTLTAEMLGRSKLSAEDARAGTALLIRSTRRMGALLDSLLEYTRATVGGGMTIYRTRVDLKEVCAEELELLRVALPKARIEFVADGDATGEFDAPRVREALSNLVTNAVKHGLGGEPVTARLSGGRDEVLLVVENAIAPDMQHIEVEPLFEPLHRGDLQRPGSERTHLGLGLFIARQIAQAHGGTANGEFSERKAKFTLSLPRIASAHA